MLEPPAPHSRMPSGFRQYLSEFLAEMTDRRPLGVAVSGGSDSLGLLYGLASVCAPGKLFALTVDHGLRSGSADEARRVKAHCRRLGVCHETLRWENAQPGSGLQAAARAARYRLLGSAAGRLGLAGVLTGHTSDDQQETLEMRRARSPSERAAGLAGIPLATLFDGRMWVLRPLLGVGRAEIRDFLRGAGVEWIEDPSNSDARFERVRIRGLLKEAHRAATTEDGARIAALRFRLAQRAASYIEGRCCFETVDTVRMKCSWDDDPEVVAAVMEALVDLCGGAERPLDRRGKATLRACMRTWASLSSDDRNGRAITLGRTMMQMRGGDVLIRRERRGLNTLDLEPGASAVWDGRYRIENLSRTSFLRVDGGGPYGVSPSFSRHLNARKHGWVAQSGVEGGFLCQRLIGRSSCILPVYELTLAQALAHLAGGNRFPECPWDVSGSNMASTTGKAG